MMYFLDKSRQEKAIAIATRLDETIKDKNVKVRFFRLICANFWILSALTKHVSLQHNSRVDLQSSVWIWISVLLVMVCVTHIRQMGMKIQAYLGDTVGSAPDHC